MRARRSRIIATVVLTIAVAVIAALPTIASAARLDSPTEGRYIGWAYVANNTATDAWKWSPDGWTKSSFAAGTTVWAHPYGVAGWEWAYRDGSWYAMRARYLESWRCGTPRTLYTVSQLSTMHRYNTASSQSYGVIPPGTQVTRLCSNSFTDAGEAPGTMYCMAIGCGPTEWILVSAKPMPACMYAPAGMPVCMIAMPIGGFPEKTGYIALPRPGFFEGATGNVAGGYRGG